MIFITHEQISNFILLFTGYELSTEIHVANKMAFCYVLDCLGLMKLEV